MTTQELASVGCCRWSHTSALMLFPASWFDEIPIGFEVLSILGHRQPFSHTMSRDTRYGMLAFGVEAAQ